ncbi:hypothetical protein HPB47_023601, partial [Ixodes persulcatus]
MGSTTGPRLLFNPPLKGGNPVLKLFPPRKKLRRRPKEIQKKNSPEPKVLSAAVAAIQPSQGCPRLPPTEEAPSVAVEAKLGGVFNITAWTGVTDSRPSLANPALFPSASREVGPVGAVKEPAVM